MVCDLVLTVDGESVFSFDLPPLLYTWIWPDEPSNLEVNDPELDTIEGDTEEQTVMGDFPADEQQELGGYLSQSQS